MITVVTKVKMEKLDLLLLCLKMTLLFRLATCQTGPVPFEMEADVDQGTVNMLINNLERFGYLPPSNEIPGAVQDLRNFTDALIRYQRFGNISQTGDLDSATVQLLQTPRCGVPDVLPFSTSGTKWLNNQIRYRFGRLTPDLDASSVRSELRRAFQVWADVTPLTFVEVGPGQAVDIDISFGSYSHGDSYPFDGQGGVLAHAFLPRGGDAHFDDSETWTINSYYGTNLFWVAAHEFGHSLGLYHSDVRSALMYPYYGGYQPNFSLDRDDILGMQSLYGPNTGSGTAPTTTTRPPTTATTTRRPTTTATTTRRPTITTTTRPTPPATPTTTQVPPVNPIPRGACSGSVDAVFTDTVGRIFALTGLYYWRFDVSPPFNGQIQTRFGSSFPDVVDAAFQDTFYTYIFSGCYVYQYYGFQFRGSYPINRRWVGIPCEIDAVYKSIDGFTYFFKDQYVYKFQEYELRSRRRITSTGFQNLPSDLYDGVDAVSTFDDSYVYFFRNGRYYRMIDGAKRFEFASFDVIEAKLPVCRNLNQETC